MMDESEEGIDNAIMVIEMIVDYLIGINILRNGKVMPCYSSTVTVLIAITLY